MKKMVFATVLGAALVIPFAAQAAGGYVGGGLGRSTYDVDDAGMTTTSRDEKGSGWKLYGGFELSPNWGVELGYANLGKMRNVYNVFGTNVAVTAKSYSMYVAGTGTVPLGDQFSLFGKLGLAANHTSVTGTAGGFSASDSGNKSGIMFGAGAAFNVTKNVALTLEYDHFGKVAEDAKAQMWSLGARYKF
jgi:OOP family OmpA-OmpF porin